MVKNIHRKELLMEAHEYLKGEIKKYIEDSFI